MIGVLRGNRAGSHDAWRKSGLVVGIICLTTLLAACGGEDEEGDAAPQTLTISGTPAAQALQGQAYSFAPTVTPSSGTLTFSVAGTPPWATFNATNGRLSGTPSSAQVGMVFSNIRISVTDGATTVNLPAFSITIVATATGSALLTWNPPTQNTDGTSLSNLAGYRVYWGTTQNSLTNSKTINNSGLASYVVDQLTPATWYFAVSAVNNSGVESSLSNVASKQVL